MKVVFDFAKNQASIEGDGSEMLDLLKEIRALAPKLSRIELITSPASSAESPLHQRKEESDHRADDQKSRGSVPGLREFSRSIGPTNNYQRIAAIAAYKLKFEQVETFSPKEMGEWFVMCGFEKPSQMPVAMFDAKRKYGYLDKAGHGKWKLATGGQNLVTRKLESIAIGGAA